MLLWRGESGGAAPLVGCQYDTLLGLGLFFSSCVPIGNGKNNQSGRKVCKIRSSRPINKYISQIHKTLPNLSSNGQTTGPNRMSSGA